MNHISFKRRKKVSSLMRKSLLLAISALLLPQLFHGTANDTSEFQNAISAQARPGRLRERIKERKAKRDRRNQKEAVVQSTNTGLPPMRVWIDPRVQPRACLLCIHGLGLHSGMYEFFGKGAAKAGVAVYAMDVRGFGAWMNAGGKAKVDFEGCLVDVKNSLIAIRQKHPNLPVYLLGESMGGAIALRAASLYPKLIDGLISSVPAEERFKQKRTSLKVAANVLRRPKRRKNIGNDIVDQASTNEALKQDWKNDPLSRLDLSPKELIQFQAFMNDNHDSAKNVTSLPVLFVQGTKDKLVKPEGTWELFNKLATKDKVFLAVPGEHLIFEESQLQNPFERQQNMRMVATWIMTKIGWRNNRRMVR